MTIKKKFIFTFEINCIIYFFKIFINKKIFIKTIKKAKIIQQLIGIVRALMNTIESISKI